MLIVGKSKLVFMEQYLNNWQEKIILQGVFSMKNKILRFWAASAAAPAMLLLVLCIFVGCQTTVPVTYTEPARMNLSGVNRIAVDSNDPQVTNSISQRLNATGRYTMATEEELVEWKRWRDEIQAMGQLASHQAQAITITAANLVEAYAANAVRADASYRGKVLRITGVVNEIQQSSRGRYFVRLVGAGNDSVVVYFRSSETSRLAAVNRNQTITIIGECVGRNLPDMDDTAEILRLLGAGNAVSIIDATFPLEGLREYSGTVDAVISLNTNFSVQDSTSSRQHLVVDADGNVLKDAYGNALIRNVTVYNRRAIMDIAYQVVRTRDSSIIGQGTKSKRSPESSNENLSSLPDLTWYRGTLINEAIAEFMSEIVPTRRSVSVALVVESDNKNAKKEMSVAERLVRARDYAAAAAEYGTIYAKYQNFAAGYNQAVLTEAAEGTQAAIVLMEALFRETGNTMAQTALGNMQSRNASNQQAATQISQ
jgi:hypothetical protein